MSAAGHPDLRFKRPELADELAEAHPKLRQLLVRLGVWSREQGLPAPVVTCVRRSLEENERVGGVRDSLHISDAAADLRVTHYSPEQKREVGQWLIANCPSDTHELRLTPHGTGQHFHVAIKDRHWRQRPGVV